MIMAVVNTEFIRRKHTHSTEEMILAVQINAPVLDLPYPTG